MHAFRELKIIIMLIYGQIVARIEYNIDDVKYMEVEKISVKFHG